MDAWGLSGSGASNLMDDSFLQVSVGFFTIFFGGGCVGGGQGLLSLHLVTLGRAVSAPGPLWFFALFSKNLTYSNGVT